jgi:integrase
MQAQSNRRSRKPNGTPGVVTIHSRTCRTRAGGRCNCDPTYEAWVWSKRDQKKIRRKFRGEGARDAAKSWRIDAAKLVKDRRLRAPTSRTLRDEVNEWLAGAKDGRILNKRQQPYKPNVIRNYELALRLRVLPDLGERKLGDIDFADLLALKEELQGNGRSGSTIRNTFVPLQAIYRRARRNGIVAVNPALDLELPSSGTRDRAATPHEATELLAVLPEFERTIWATAFYAGLRRGELRALRVRDVDLDAKLIRVERGWDDVEGPIEPKSRAGRREVFLLRELRPLLEPLVEGRDADALLLGYGDARPFDTRAIARKAQRAWTAENKQREEKEREEADEPPLEVFTLHEARHSFSTWLDHAGVSETRADRYMGHAASGVAGRYRHMLPGQLSEDAAKLQAYLAGNEAGKVVAIALAQ